MKFRRAFIPVLVAAAVAFTACGSTEDEDGGSGSASASADSGAPVTLTDARGEEVTLENGPAKEVVALEWMEAEVLATLGVMPVGVADVEGYSTWVSAAPLDEAVADVGTRAEPSVDAVIDLEPDLVVMEDDRGEGLVEQLERYAPVLVIKGSDASGNLDQLRTNVTMIAEAVGKQDEAEARLTELDDAIDDAKGKVTAAGAEGAGFAMADGYVEGSTVSLRMFGKGSLMSDLAEAIGLKNQWSGEVDAEWGLSDTDVEGLSGLQDLHFFYSASEEDPFAGVLADNPIWSSLPFVASGQVHKLENGTWTFGGPASAEHFLDQVVAAVAA